MEPITNPSPKSPSKSAGSGSKKAAASASQKKIRKKSFEMELVKLVSEIQQCKENLTQNSASARKRIRNKKNGKCKKENGLEQSLVGRNSGDGNTVKKGPQERCGSIDGRCNTPEEFVKTKMPKSGVQKRVKVLKEKAVFKKKVGSNLTAMLSGKDSRLKSEKEKQTSQELGKLTSKKLSAEFCSAENQPLRDKNSNRKKKKPETSKKDSQNNSRKSATKKESEMSKKDSQNNGRKSSAKNMSACQASEYQELEPTSPKSNKGIKSKQNSAPKNDGTTSVAASSNNNFERKVNKETVASKVEQSKTISTKGKKGKGTSFVIFF